LGNIFLAQNATETCETDSFNKTGDFLMKRLLFPAVKHENIVAKEKD
jgi:hypothetical protein